jgi:anti-sigma B factor antagonist
MSLSMRKVGKVCILDLSGKLMGGPDADDFKNSVRQLTSEGCVKVIVNLAEVPWVNSTGLGVLVAGYTSLRREHGILKLCNVSDRVQSILMVTRLSTVFETFVGEAEAVASFG